MSDKKQQVIDLIKEMTVLSSPNLSKKWKRYLAYPQLLPSLPQQQPPQAPQPKLRKSEFDVILPTQATRKST
jgi:ribosomal protein L7/L12